MIRASHHMQALFFSIESYCLHEHWSIKFLAFKYISVVYVWIYIYVQFQIHEWNRNELVSNNKAHKNYNMKIILFIMNIQNIKSKRQTCNGTPNECVRFKRSEKRCTVCEPKRRDYGYVWGWYRWNSVSEV